MAYKVYRVPLDNIILPSVPTEVVAPSLLIGAVAIPKVDAGVAFAFALGRTNDFVDVDSPVSWEAEEDEKGGGLYLSNAVAQAGKVAVIVVTFAKPGDGLAAPGSMASSDPSHANPATRQPPGRVVY